MCFKRRDNETPEGCKVPSRLITRNNNDNADKISKIIIITMSTPGTERK